VAYDEDLADRVRAVLMAAELVTERQMLGRVAFMLRGHMYCSVVKDTLTVRLGPAGADRALNRPHVRPMDFTGCPVTGMVFVEPGGLIALPCCGTWVGAADSTRSLPSKPAASPEARWHRGGLLRWQAGADRQAARPCGPLPAIRRHSGLPGTVSG
jgi:TfoX-like protein